MIIPPGPLAYTLIGPITVEETNSLTSAGRSGLCLEAGGAGAGAGVGYSEGSGLHALLLGICRRRGGGGWRDPGIILGLVSGHRTRAVFPRDDYASVDSDIRALIDRIQLLSNPFNIRMLSYEPYEL